MLQVYKCTICKQTFTSKKAMETHIKMAHSDSNTSRNGPEGESSCASSTSDKENKIEVLADVHYSLRTSTTDCSTPSEMTLEQEGDQDRLATHLPIYDNSAPTGSGSNSMNEPTVRVGSRGDECTSNIGGDPNASPYYTRLQSHTHGGLDTALLAVATAASEELVVSYQNNSAYSQPHPSKFQIPASATGAHYYRVASPSSYSDSSRSSLSPKLEIVEPAEDSSLYIVPEYTSDLPFHEPTPTSSSSVIIQVPYSGGLTPSSSSSTSPVPSSPDIVDLPVVKEEISLPPRKRTKMILKSMEKDKVEDSNFRYNSVIHYAKASQIA